VSAWRPWRSQRGPIGAGWALANRFWALGASRGASVAVAEAPEAVSLGANVGRASAGRRARNNGVGAAPKTHLGSWEL